MLNKASGIRTNSGTDEQNGRRGGLQRKEREEYSSERTDTHTRDQVGVPTVCMVPIQNNQKSYAAALLMFVVPQTTRSFIFLASLRDNEDVCSDIVGSGRHHRLLSGL